MLLTIVNFVGRLHPLLVHLPIGILIIGLVLQWLSQKEKYHISHSVLKIIILTGMFTAFLSCITGYVLSISEKYDDDLINWHFWMGICVAVSSMFLFMKVARKEYDWIYKSLSVGVLVFLLITAHLGASITHGRDYLFGSGKEKAGMGSDSTITRDKGK